MEKHLKFLKTSKARIIKIRELNEIREALHRVVGKCSHKDERSFNILIEQNTNKINFVDSLKTWVYFLDDKTGLHSVTCKDLEQAKDIIRNRGNNIEDDFKNIKLVFPKSYYDLDREH